MSRLDQPIKNSIVEVDSWLDIVTGPHLAVDVVEAEAAAGVRVEADENVELFLRGGLVDGGHEVGDLVGGAVEVAAVEGVGEGVEGGVGGVEVLLAEGEVEEAGVEGGGDERVRVAEELGEEVGGEAVEGGSEVGEEGRGPAAAVAEEEIEDVAGEGGEAAGTEGDGGRRG